MTTLKHRCTALLCLLALLCTLLPIRASAATVYLMALNDKMCDLPGGLLPTVVDDTIYVPYYMFDKSITGVDLGVYYGLSQDLGPVLTLYSRSGYLTFTINKSLCQDDQGNDMGIRAVIRSGAIYVPAAAVCNYFGLHYSNQSTTDRGNLIRITNQDATVEDSRFLLYATQSMLYRYNNIMKSKEPPTPVQPVPTPTSRPTLPPDEQDREHSHVRVYLAVDATQANEVLLTLLNSSVPPMLFLFDPDELVEQSALVRHVVAAGHSVGLMLDTTDEVEALAQLDRGNELLRHIVRLRTRIVSAPIELMDPLTQAGWSCWIPNVNSSNQSGILWELNQKNSVGRVTLSPSASLINQLCRELREERYHLRQPLETEL